MKNYQFIAKIWQEDDWFIAQDIFSGVTSQGRSIENARDNLKEAVELYFEDENITKNNDSQNLINTILMPLEVGLNYEQKVTI